MSRISPHLSASDLGATVADRDLFTGVNVTLNPGRRILVVGENGTGKTTLLHTLAGIRVPDAGEAHRTGSLTLVRQGMDATGTVGDLVADATAAADRALADLDDALSSGDLGDAYDDALDRATMLDAWDVHRRVDVSLAGLNACTDRTRPLWSLSHGQRHRVRLACALASRADTLLLDEPTNHLDAAALDFLTAQLLAWTAHRRADRERWEREHEAQVAKHQRLEAAVADARSRLSDNWRPPKGHFKHKRATRADGVVRALHRREAALAGHAVEIPEPPPELRWPTVDVASGRTLLTCADVSVSGRLGPVTVDLSGGEHLLLTGPNGAGKSTFVEVITGVMTPTSGTVTVHEGVRVGVLTQHEPEWPHPGLVAAEVYARHASALQERCQEGAAGQPCPGLASLGLLDRQARSTPVGRLSQGQQRRLHLAMVLAQRPELLILDEPTNHLSAVLVDAVTAAVRASAAGVIVVTHDRQMLRDLGETAGWRRLELG